MTPFEVRQLQHLTHHYGEMSSPEALELALQAEQYAKDCGPFDMAFQFFKHQQIQMELYASLLEKGGK